MKDLCHQHICKLYQVIETETKFFMILEVFELQSRINTQHWIIKSFIFLWYESLNERELIGRVLLFCSHVIYKLGVEKNLICLLNSKWSNSENFDVGNCILLLILPFSSVLPWGRTVWLHCLQGQVIRGGGPHLLQTDRGSCSLHSQSGIRPQGPQAS